MLRRGFVGDRDSRGGGRWALACVAFCVLAAGWGLAVAQQDEQETSASEPRTANPIQAERAARVVGALAAQQGLLGDLVLDAVREYRRIAMKRVSAHQELEELESQLDRAVTRIRELSASDLDEIADQVMEARVRYRSLSESADRKLAMVEQLLRQQEALARRVAELRARAPVEEGVLTGEWEVVWRPSNLRGTFYLDQSGTLVTGQYRLGPRRTGSLRGTFVGNKIRLERVDSERGRDAELEGYLSSDGSRIEGTWQAFEMVQGGLPRGQWIARRVD